MAKKSLIILLTSILLIGCTEERDLSQNTVIAHITSQPDGLHPYNNNSVMRSYVFEYTQKTLLKLDLESLDYMPDLLKKMPESSEDNRTFYFELKENIRWDDGSQLTAEDIEFTTKIMLCHLTDNSQIRPIYNSVIESVQINPENPLKFTMRALDINWTAKTILGGIYIQQKDRSFKSKQESRQNPDQICNGRVREEETKYKWGCCKANCPD